LIYGPRRPRKKIVADVVEASVAWTEMFEKAITAAVSKGDQGGGTFREVTGSQAAIFTVGH